MYKILSIAALTAGMLLLTPGAQAARMDVEMTANTPAAHSQSPGRQVAAARANPNARFNRDARPTATMPGSSMPRSGSTGTVTAVPEPGALGLLGAAMIAATVVRRRRRRE
jgi:hypothetical protein